MWKLRLIFLKMISYRDFYHWLRYRVRGGREEWISFRENPWCNLKLRRRIGGVAQVDAYRAALDAFIGEPPRTYEEQLIPWWRR